MRNLPVNERSAGAGECATRASFAGSGAISFICVALLLLAILSSSGCIGVTSAPNRASSLQTTPGAGTISVVPASIQFGSVALGSTSSQSVTISNAGGSNLTITRASATAAGVTITGGSLPLVIGAGKQATFDVVFSPKAPGALSGDVSIVSDISSSPSTVSLSGIGMAASALLTTTASSLNFGSVTVGKSSVLSLNLTNVGNSSVTVSKVSVSGAHYSANGVSAGLILAPGQSATLDVAINPTAAGNFSGGVSVASNATNSPATISLSGAGTSTVAHSVALAWNPSTSAVAGYNVYRSETSGGPYSRLDSNIVAAESYTDFNVQAGFTYYYVVTSVTSGGVESPDSGQTWATVP